ncbi:MAG: GNAT family N-acetyltransferase [Burkholderiales bacterium]|nr:GNAT family N-acetyltransferase [Burkholderiales bacterium]
MQLVWPAPEYLRSYCEALQRGWSPNNLQPQVAQEELAAIKNNPDAFFEQLVNFEGGGIGVKLPDGSVVPRLPGYRRWMWDGEFCGSIQLRWATGAALPDYCLGHIGYSVVPWKQRRGYATCALALLLREARSRGLPHVEITTSPDNAASQKVITANGGVLVEEFEKLASLGGGRELRFRVGL